MDMNINKTSTYGTTYTPQTIASGTSAHKAGGVKPNFSQLIQSKLPRTDTVNFSSKTDFQAQLEKSTKAVAKEVAEVDNSNKVEALKQEVSAGTYSIASANVAGAILAKLL
jgi:anti-sigma28 factor (negative regulator of flagellin synthesis)